MPAHAATSPATTQPDTGDLRPPSAGATVAGKAGIKAYLLFVLRDRCVRGAADLKTHADAYAKLVADAGGDYAAAAKDHPDAFRQLILAMRRDYQRIDSFGYEYVEGIVAGVPSMKRFDTELDAGVPAAGSTGDQPVANVKIAAGGVAIDREGSLNNYLIEPTVFGSNPKFVAARVKAGGEEFDAPKAALIVALADYAVNGYDRLWKAASAWEPTTQDCFTAAAAMTPTLGDYFDEWKESKLGRGASGGRFVAVSRISDMEGIMSSTRLIWEAVRDEAAAKEPATAAEISAGYRQIMEFLGTIEKMESGGGGKLPPTRPSSSAGDSSTTQPASATPAGDAAYPAPAGGMTPGMTPDQIDALGSQAKELADNVHAKVVEVAGKLGINLE